MPSPFRELHNNSNTSASSYETAWSSSFSNRKSINNDSSLSMKPIKDEPEIDLDESISNLENNISMMSVSSPISPGYRTPARKPAREAPMTPGERILQKVETNQEKELLKQLYPEMFQDASQPPPQRPKNIKKELKIEPMTDDEDANKENRPPWGAEKEVKKQRSRKIVISSDSEDEGEFDDYLKNLRKEPSKPLKAERKARTTQKKFVVEDDYISEEDSGGSSDASEEEEEEVSDEEFREFSPEVVVPKVKSKKKRPSDDEEWFLVSLTENYSGEIHNDAKVYVKDGALRLKKHRESLLTRLQDILLRRIFSAIPSDELVVTWNPRLRKSAGQCRNHRNGKSTVEMSSVVCTTAERVRDTFIHEMCHAAVWVVDKLHKEGHGPGWKRWGARCSSTFKSLPFIERCHDYEIEAKFYYVCENDTCTVEIKRQSKSLDTSRKACGRCLGRFILYRYCRKTNSRIRIEDPNRNKSVSATASKPTPSPPAVRRNFTKHPEGFREFSEKHYWDYSDAGLKHSEVIEILLKEFNERNNL